MNESEPLGEMSKKMIVDIWLQNFLEIIDIKKAGEIIRNLELDGVIDSITWKKFCSTLKSELLKIPIKGSSEANKLFNEICAQYCLSGPAAKIPQEVRILNRVISEDVFKTYCLGAIGVPTTSDDGRVCLEEFFKKKLAEQKEAFKQANLTIGRTGEVVWAFFPEPDKGSIDPNPIDDPRVQHSANALREILGLECTEQKGVNFICFRYQAEKVQNKKVPLAISAGFNPCFNPSGSAPVSYGWTFNRQTQQNGFPEIVHEDLLIGNISFPLIHVTSERTD